MTQLELRWKLLDSAGAISNLNPFICSTFFDIDLILFIIPSIEGGFLLNLEGIPASASSSTGISCKVYNYRLPIRRILNGGLD